MRSFDATVTRLCALSAPGTHLSSIPWPDRVDPEAEWYTSPELCSLYGTSSWDALDGRSRRRLSFFEAVHFFSMNIHGERFLIEGLARRLYSRVQRGSSYLHCFLGEENEHMRCFGTFCERYAGKVYPDRTISIPRDYAPGEEDVLFFACALAFEEIVDAFNLRMARDDRLSAVVRSIHEMHHQDESRHLAYGRAVLRELVSNHSPGWSPETLAGVGKHLSGYVTHTWTALFDSTVYADAGVPDPIRARSEALVSDATLARRELISAKCMHALRECGLVQEA